MKNLKVAEILRILRKDGWYIDHQKGSHRKLKHPTKKGYVTVAGKESLDIGGKTLDSIASQAGLEF